MERRQLFLFTADWLFSFLSLFWLLSAVTTYAVSVCSVYKSPVLIYSLIPGSYPSQLTSLVKVDLPFQGAVLIWYVSHLTSQSIGVTNMEGVCCGLQVVKLAKPYYLHGRDGLLCYFMCLWFDFGGWNQFRGGWCLQWQILCCCFFLWRGWPSQGCSRKLAPLWTELTALWLVISNLSHVVLDTKVIMVVIILWIVHVDCDPWDCVEARIMNAQISRLLLMNAWQLT